MKIFPAKELIKISLDFEARRLEKRNLGLGYREYEWYWYKEKDQRGAMHFVPNLFRGQTRRYPTMLPSIARDLEINEGELYERSSSDQAKIILGLAQSWWFARELEYHPITNHAAQSNIKLDKLALAQHYGIPTGYLDLTDDFNVSAFFATCYWTENGWKPLSEDSEYNGIIYRIELRGLKNPFSEYKPLGPQPLPRPTEQSAWVTELPITHSFDGWPNVYLMQFNHDKAVGEYFLEKFNGGEALFPFDPLSEIAREILDCKEIPSELVDKAIKSFVNDKFGIKPYQVSNIEKEISKVVTRIDYRRLLNEEHISSLFDDFEWRKKMLPEIKAISRIFRDEPNISLNKEKHDDNRVDGSDQ